MGSESLANTLSAMALFQPVKSECKTHVAKQVHGGATPGPHSDSEPSGEEHSQGCGL